MAQYILKRILYMIPTIFAISAVSFIIISLPPGDFVDSIVAQARYEGEYITEEEAAGMRAVYGLDKPLTEQYINWITDIILHGDFGTSFSWSLPVSTLIWERLGLTLVLSLSSLLFIWVVAIPIGVYSAVRQYSVGDYVFTFLGFIGLAIPNFLLALVLMYVSFRYLGQSVGGLFSPEFLDKPWSIAKLWICSAICGYR